MIDAERLREELLWENVFLTDNEIDALVDLIDNQPTISTIEAAEALCEIQIELQAMRGAANSYKAELEKVKGKKGPDDSTNQRRVLDLHQAI